MFDKNKYQKSKFKDSIINILEEMDDNERKDWYVVSSSAMSGIKEACDLIKSRFQEANVGAYYQIMTICYDSLSAGEKHSSYNEAMRDLQRMGTGAINVEHEMAIETEKHRIQIARMKAGLSRAEMSRQLEIPIRTIENWESGVRKCPEWTVKLIVEKLDSMRKAAES